MLADPILHKKVIAELTQEKLASVLYDSLQNKIMPLSDNLVVYPGHGAGSACGKKMSKETTDTLGNQKLTNYAFRPGITKEEFIKEVLDGLTNPPGYFPQNVLLNIAGYEPLDTILERGMKMLTLDEFERFKEVSNIVILDTRSPDEFAKGFIRGSINIGIDGSFAVWVGTIIPDVKQHLLLIADPGREKEVILRLARVGYDYAIGFLSGGFNSWKAAGKRTEQIVSISAHEFASDYKPLQDKILDVRKASEFESEHIINAVNAPLDYLAESEKLVNESEVTYVHCAAGYRSMIFVSCLRKKRI